MGFQLNTCVALGYFVRIKTQKGAQLWLMLRQTGGWTDRPVDGRTDSDRFVSPFLGNLFLLQVWKRIILNWCSKKKNVADLVKLKGTMTIWLSQIKHRTTQNTQLSQSEQRRHLSCFHDVEFLATEYGKPVFTIVDSGQFGRLVFLAAFLVIVIWWLTSAPWLFTKLT